MAKVFVEGLDDLEDALKELPKATAKNVLLRVLKKRAQPIADLGSSLAPRGVTTGPRKLADSYTVSTKLNPAQKRKYPKESAVEVYVGPAPSAKSIVTEFGSVHVGPRPHLRPAWDSTRATLLDNIAGDLANEIDKAVQRAARKAERLAAKMKA